MPLNNLQPQPIRADEIRLNELYAEWDVFELCIQAIKETIKEIEQTITPLYYRGFVWG